MSTKLLNSVFLACVLLLWQTTCCGQIQVWNPDNSLNKQGFDTVLKRLNMLSPEVTLPWREALAAASGDVIEKAQAAMLITQVQSLFPQGTFDRVVSDRLLARCKALPGDDVRLWQGALADVAGEPVGRVPVALEMIQLDRLFPQEQFSRPESGAMLARIKSISKAALEDSHKQNPTEPRASTVWRMAIGSAAKPPVMDRANRVELRTWTDESGQHKLAASFAGLENQKVRLKKKDGLTIEVPLEKLSPADQAWAKAQGGTSQRPKPSDAARDRNMPHPAKAAGRSDGGNRFITLNKIQVLKERVELGISTVGVSAASKEAPKGNKFLEVYYVMTPPATSPLLPPEAIAFAKEPPPATESELDAMVQRLRAIRLKYAREFQARKEAALALRPLLRTESGEEIIPLNEVGIGEWFSTEVTGTLQLFDVDKCAVFLVPDSARTLVMTVAGYRPLTIDLDQAKAAGTPSTKGTE